jgi:hypothetical protein
MINVRYSLRRGYILSIADLRNLLTEISYGSRRWWTDNDVTLLRDPEEPTFCLTLFHSCPTEGQITDEISFQVPVLLASLAPRNIESALVCLHPEMIRPLVEGLYLENGRVLGDCLQDWYLFWDPLKVALAGALQQSD